MTNLPEWALPIRDAMARTICDHTREMKRFDDLDDHNKAFWRDHATAALAEALPMVAGHFAGVAKNTTPPKEAMYGENPIGRGISATQESIATAIRREANP